MNQDKIKIYRFFGKIAQYSKAKEEFMEIVHAFIAFILSPTRDNLIHLVSELDDLTNVLEGMGAVEHGISENELHADKEYKIHRTTGLMSKCTGEDKVEQYNRLRRSL